MLKLYIQHGAVSEWMPSNHKSTLGILNGCLDTMQKFIQEIFI